MNLFDELKNAGEELPIPESLSPDFIENKLQNVPVKSRKKELPKLLLSLTTLAACLLLFFNLFSSPKPFEQEYNQEAATEASICEDNLPQETTVAINYDELYQIMSRLYEEQEQSEYYIYENEFDGFKKEGIQDTPSSTNFSDTNKQVADVDEEDFVKTDGEYIYYIQDSRSTTLRIVKADNGRLREMATIVTPNSPRGFYLNGNQLILIEADTATRYYPQPIKPEIKTMSFSKGYMPHETYTTISFYDISDKLHPVKTNSLSMEGDYSSSRIHDGYLYLFASYNLHTKPVYEKMDTYVPTIDGKPLSADCIIMPECPAEPSYLNIASVNLAKPETFTDYKAVVSGSNKHYFVSSDKIYVASGNNSTEIFSFSYKNGYLYQEATGKVPGALTDDFAMNAYNGYLRIVTTANANNLYVLDNNLNIAGKIENLAPGERIYSARFMDDVGYFVTFRQKDPLFSVDLSDPANPRILGELKIPGFSEYLHPYGDSLLFGIGQEVNPDTGERKGLKLSIFDISNPANVKESTKLVLSDILHSDAWFDYKAVLIDPEKNLIGFGGTDYTDNHHYYLYRYEKGLGFEQMLDLNWNSYYDLRGLYIGDILYVLDRNNIMESYSIETGTKLGELEERYETQ